MSVLSLSHTDLDGISCQIVLRQSFGEITRMNIGYNKIDEYINIIDDYCKNNKPDKVFVTDLSFTIEQLIDLHRVTTNNKSVQFYFIDHHPLGEEFEHLKTDNFHIIHSVKASATKLTYLYCKANFGINESEDLFKYVQYVNSYDIWLEDTPEFKVGFVYNELFWTYKIQHFWSKFKDSFNLRSSDKELYKELMIKKKKIFDKLESSGRMFSLGDKDVFMVFLDDFTSHISIDYSGYKIYVIARSYGGISIRIRDGVSNAEEFKDTVVQKILQLDNIANSGGHPKAFGVTLEDNAPSKMIDFAKSLIQILDSELDNLKF